MKRLLTAILLLATAGFSGFADPGWVGFQGLSHLDSLELVDSNTGLDGPDTDNFSGCCIMPATQELLVIINSPEAIQVYGLDGSYKRRIDLSGFDDTEGICQYDPANDLFAIVEEDANDITVVTIMASTTSIAKSSGTTHAMGLTFGSPNKGIEGIAYDPVRDCFYACKEKLSMAVYRVTYTGGVSTVELFDAGLMLGGEVNGLSDVFYDRFSGHLFFISGASERVVESDLSGNVISSHPVSGGNPEGLTFSADGKQMYVIGEPNEYYLYSVTPVLSGSGDEGVSLELAVSLDSPLTNVATVDYSGWSSNAAAGADYTPATGVVTFVPGSLAETITLHIPRDGVTESDETLQIILANPANAGLARDSVYEYTILANATNDTPEWWLSQYYPDTNDFNNAAMSDSDGDTSRAWEEYVAGTIPTDSLSVFEIGAVELDAGAFVIHWANSTNRTYSVYRSTNLTEAWSNPPLANNLPANPSGTNTFTDPNGSIEAAFYRAGVRIAD